MAAVRPAPSTPPLRRLTLAMRESSPWFLFTLCVLATWRLSHLVAREDGPFDLVLRLRARAGNGMLGRLMDCPYCLSLWIAAPAALLLAPRLPGLPEWCVAWLAISGGSSLLEKLASRAAPANLSPDFPHDFPPDGAHADALLRTTPRLADDLEPSRARKRDGDEPAA